jgi:anti-anti-sigma factor
MRGGRPVTRQVLANPRLINEERSLDTTSRESASGFFDLALEGDTVVVTPAGSLRELDFQEIEAGAGSVLAFLGRTRARNVVVDLCWMDYSGSTALGFFVRLWEEVKRRGGRMAFCNVSDHEKEILRATHLDRLWPICHSRCEACAAVQE